MMKISFHSPIQNVPHLGATKNRLELAEALRKCGCIVDVFGPKEIGVRGGGLCEYQYALRNFIKRMRPVSSEIVMLEADTLPFDRAEFSSKLVLVARPALVLTHLRLIEYPVPKESLRSVLRAAKAMYHKVAGFPVQPGWQERRRYQVETCRQVDLVQVQTSWDVDALRADGVRETPFIVIPNGVNSLRFQGVVKNRILHYDKNRFNIVFLGTFDYRKGCLDIVDIMIRLWRVNANYRLLILGARGLFQNELHVYNFFPREFRSRVEVVMMFDNAKLPELVAGAGIGIFPSYIESFGFGCLEMMAAGIPTVAYRSPGPESFVPGALLVERGGREAAVAIISKLSESASEYAKYVDRCVRVSRDYDWGGIAKRVCVEYGSAIARLGGRE